MTNRPDYKKLYTDMWEFPAYRTVSPAEVIFPHIWRCFLETEARSCIDFGCGTGRVTRELQERGIAVIGIDVAPNCLDALVRIPFLQCDLSKIPDMLVADWGICVDVLEHLTEPDIGAALDSIARSCRKGAFIRVANFPESHGRLVHAQLHETLQDVEWWADRLEDRWNNVRPLRLAQDRAPRRYSFIVF